MATTTTISGKEHVLIQKHLDVENRHYVYDSRVNESMTKDYRNVSNDRRLLEFAEDEFGAISDIYIMYAVACMGVADYSGVYGFLRGLKTRNKELNIGGMDNPESIKLRLRALFNLGLLFKTMYEVPVAGENTEGLGIDKVTLYTITPIGVSMVNNKLSCRVRDNHWIQMRPLYELESWAACGEVANYLDSSPLCIERKQGSFKTPFLGDYTVIPAIVKSSAKSGEEVFIGVVPAFFHMIPTTQTNEMFLRDVELRTNIMQQFFYAQDKKEHPARLIIVCENSGDLNVAVNYILRSPELKKEFWRIFFTGEGALAMRQEKFGGRDVFLGIKESKAKSGFSFYAAEPDFI